MELSSVYKNAITTSSEYRIATAKFKINKNVNYNGSIYHVDEILLSKVKTYKDNNIPNVVILDVDNNPTIVEDVNDFYLVCLDIFQKAMNSYYLDIKRITNV